MEQEKQVGIVYEDLTKREKISFIKSIHKKIKNNLDLDIHEIYFVMSTCDPSEDNPHRISRYLYKNRNVSYETLRANAYYFDFGLEKVFRILYTDSKFWEEITTVVNKYIKVEDDFSTKSEIISKDGIKQLAYRLNGNIPKNIRHHLFDEAKEIYERETKKFRDEERKVLNNIKINTNIKESSNNEDENDSNLVM